MSGRHRLRILLERNPSLSTNKSESRVTPRAVGLNAQVVEEIPNLLRSTVKRNNLMNHPEMMNSMATSWTVVSKLISEKEIRNVLGVTNKG
jgi:hypothetical protein